MSIKLTQANKIIAAIIKRGVELDCRPISAVVVEPGCIVKAFQKEDGASMLRFEMAFGKAYAALALSRSSKLMRIRNEEKPVFMRYLMDVSGAPRNFLRGPSFWQVDLMFSKDFRFMTTQGLQIRVEIFNITNHLNYENPSISLTSGTPGVPFNETSSRSAPSSAP